VGWAGFFAHSDKYDLCKIILAWPILFVSDPEDLLKAQKPRLYSDTPQTLEEHIKRARMLRELSQPKVAALIGVDTSTILNWEKSYTEPPIATIPAILKFPGYDPYPEGKTLGKRMLAFRRTKGWTISKAAQQTGVDVGRGDHGRAARRYRIGGTGIWFSTFLDYLQVSGTQLKIAKLESRSKVD